MKFRVRNVGQRAGKDVPQIYVSPVAGGWEASVGLVVGHEDTGRARFGRFHQSLGRAATNGCGISSATCYVTVQ